MTFCNEGVALSFREESAAVTDFGTPRGCSFLTNTHSIKPSIFTLCSRILTGGNTHPRRSSLCRNSSGRTVESREFIKRAYGRHDISTTEHAHFLREHAPEG